MKFSQIIHQVDTGITALQLNTIPTIVIPVGEDLEAVTTSSPARHLMIILFQRLKDSIMTLGCSLLSWMTVHCCKVPCLPLTPQLEVPRVAVATWTQDSEAAACPLNLLLPLAQGRGRVIVQTTKTRVEEAVLPAFGECAVYFPISPTKRKLRFHEFIIHLASHTHFRRAFASATTIFLITPFILSYLLSVEMESLTFLFYIRRCNLQCAFQFINGNCDCIFLKHH